MEDIVCVIVSTLKQLDEAAWVRWQVFVEEERLLPRGGLVTGRELDVFDTLHTTTHLLVYDGDKPVAMARLVGENPEVARLNGTRLGLPLEEQCEIVRGLGEGQRIAEVSRLAVRTKWRRDKQVLRKLCEAILAEGRRQGRTHLLGVSNAHTDDLEDARLAHEVATRQGLISSEWCIEPRGDTAPVGPGRKQWYGPEQRDRAMRGEYARLHLPPTLSLVVKRGGARIAGGPIYEPGFTRFGLPIVIEPLKAPWNP